LLLLQDTKRSRLSDAGQRTIIQMVPRLTNEPNGVADYAFALSRAFRIYGIDSIFLAAAPSAEERAGEDGWDTVSLPKRQARSLAETIKSAADSTKVAAVLLHMSGYGYAKRGAPAWLLQGLRRWQLRYANQLPLITIFHELYAVGRRPWQSSFWLSPVQKVITRSILDLSSDAIVTTQLFRDQLLRWNPAARVTCMPVFSNVGEPDHCAPPNARCAIGVVFGLAGVEDRLFGHFRRDIERVITTIGIEKIIDIGPRSHSVPVSFAGVPVISKGALPAFAVSSLLERAKFGFVAYPFDVLAKSGVFAAYAAHGTIPIVFADRRESFDGLEDGRHFLDGVKLNATVHPDRLTLVQHQLSGWYRAHSLQVQAHHLYQCATNSTGLQASPVASRSSASRQ
jgi:hypothetical protein